MALVGAIRIESVPMQRRSFGVRLLVKLFKIILKLSRHVNTRLDVLGLDENEALGIFLALGFGQGHRHLKGYIDAR